MAFWLNKNKILAFWTNKKKILANSDEDIGVLAKPEEKIPGKRKQLKDVWIKEIYQQKL